MQKQHEELHTSQEWQDHFGCLVYDPDGWDRQNYQYSWYEEKITEDEFRNRVSKSSMLWRGNL